MYPYFLTHLPNNGHMSDCNMWEVYYICNIFSYTYVNFQVLATISNCSMRSYKSFRVHDLSFRPVQFSLMDQDKAPKKKSLQYNQDSTLHIVTMLWSGQPQIHG
jgi:phosphoribulokinase